MKPLWSLAAIGALCAALLAGTHRITADAIGANREAQAWRIAFELTGGVFPTAELRWEGDRLTLPNGYLLRRTSVEGYAGPIELLAAFHSDSNAPCTALLPPGAPNTGRRCILHGARVVKHQETPGLGDFIDIARSPWMLRFSALPPHQVDAVTGATITSEAVKRGLSALLEATDEPAYPQSPDSPAGSPPPSAQPGVDP